MPITYPIELPPQVVHLEEGGWAYYFVLSWANSYRSLDFAVIPQGPDLLQPGQLMHNLGDGTWEKATAPGQVDAILCHYAAVEGGPDRITIVTRDAEVRDAGLDYDGMNVAQCNERLKELNIIVREAIHPSSVVAGFGVNLWSEGSPAVGLKLDTHVGLQSYKGNQPQEVKPSPGVNSVLPDGSVGQPPEQLPDPQSTPTPRPSPQQRR